MPDPMSAETSPKPEMAETETTPATEEQRADAGIEPEVAEAPAPDRTAELEAAVADLRDRLLRTHAEMENLRRRTEREVQDAKRYAVSAFARDLLGVADNLRRAIEASVPVAADTEDAVDDVADPALAGLLQGIEITERELLKSLEKNGVTKLSPKGQLFDPHRHEAVFEAPDPSVPSGTVVQVMQEGYMIGDRILRPAMVGVARGGPKPAAPGVDKSA